MEKNTFATSIYIDAPVEDVTAFLGDGMNLNRYTLFSRMQEQVDATTWRGTASGYQSGLYYHVRQRDLGVVRVVEWHCGAEYGAYHHVYPMLVFPRQYFEGEQALDAGTYYHWISFVDPERCTPMIPEGMPPVHRAEAHSLKAEIERGRGHRRGVLAPLELRSHSIYIEVPAEVAVSYFSDPATVAEWWFMLHRDGDAIVDEYGHRVEIAVQAHALGAYTLVEHDTHYVDHGVVVRTPIVLVPCTYAFGRPDAPGVIMHRVSAWPRPFGKCDPDHYDAEAINGKRIVEARGGNLEAYGYGCSYRGSRR